MGFTPIVLPSVRLTSDKKREEDEDQFRYHGKLIKMGFTPIALPLDRPIIKEYEDRFIYRGRLIKNGFHSNCASISLHVRSAIKEEMGN
jgi:hypothetical protein